MWVCGVFVSVSEKKVDIDWNVSLMFSMASAQLLKEAKAVEGCSACL